MELSRSSRGISPPGDRPALVPVSYIQEYLWEKIDRGDHSPAAMNMAFSIGLKGSVNEALLKEVIEGIVDKVEILRTNFKRIGIDRCQIIRQKTPFRLKVVDYQELEPSKRERSVMRSMRSLSGRHFDLEKDALIRARLYKLTNNSSKLFFVIHHLIFDGYSRKIFIDLVLASYNTKINSSSVQSTESITQYADFALWERNLPSKVTAANEIFWKEKLDGLASPSFLDRDVMPLQNDKCLARKFCINNPLRNRIQAVAKAQNSSLFLGLCSVFAGVLTKWSGARDFAIWFPCIQRMEPSHASTIGPIYVNLPLRVRLSGDPTFIEIMQTVRMEALSAIERQWISANRLHDAASRRQGICLNFIDARTQQRNWPIPQDSETDFCIVEDGRMRPEGHPSDIVLAITNVKQGLAAALNYNINRFSKNMIDRMIGEFCTALAEWSKNPNVALSQIVTEFHTWS